MKMNNMIKATEEIVREAEEKAIYVSPIYGLDVCMNNKTITIYPLTTSSIFYCHAGVLSWTNASGQYYLPIGGADRDRLIVALQESGYEEKAFWVHLSNGAFPIDFKEYWNRLWSEARRQEEIKRVQELNAFAEKMGIKPLPKEFIAKCFEVPLSGIEVKSFTSGTYEYRPEFISMWDSDAVKKLGKFCQNNGVLAFNNENGTYFVVEGNEENRKILHSHGYYEVSFCVAFSNAETPTDEYAKNRLDTALGRK